MQWVNLSAFSDRWQPSRTILSKNSRPVLAEHLPWHGARLNFLAQFLLALLKVRSVSLAELATGFGGKAKVDSHYKRL